MNHLYAALTDLPARAARERPPGSAAPPRLPSLERLLARGEVTEAPADWRRWALGLANLSSPPGDLPLGRWLAEAHGLPVDSTATWLIASPLRLGAGLSSLHVEDARVGLDPNAQAALAARFNAEWAGSCQLVRVGTVLLLKEPVPLEVTTTDPALLTALELREGLPRGRDAAALTRRMTEIQMWLHGAGPAAPNALWLWGAGAGPVAGQAAWPALATEDPALRAALRLYPGESAGAGGELHHWSLLDEGVSLAAAEARWFAPLEAALAAGTLAAARLHLAARTVRLSRAQSFRWWRRTRPWWEALA